MKKNVPNQKVKKCMSNMFVAGCAIPGRKAIVKGSFGLILHALLI